MASYMDNKASVASRKIASGELVLLLDLDDVIARETLTTQTLRQDLITSDTCTPTPTMSKMALEGGIVGAGIAGLAVGIAMQRAGHRATIYERSAFNNDFGAAISMTSNANLFLERWGFDFKKAG
jgi:hypothetical protein